jgi:hypothetical protein
VSAADFRSQRLNHRLAVFTCPSRSAPRLCTAPIGSELAGTAGDYAVCVGDNELNTAAFAHDNGANSPGWGVGHPFSAVTDGLSNTLLIGEKHLHVTKPGK